ncbi:MAG: hypothetical protein NZM13_05565 [Cyclobacteriaceae bacterium]|nr:hypothetical protein [Cyclobacteriaceae bacterium]
MRFSVALLLSCLTFLAFSQKIKYKDIYNLLSTKQYEAAEPFLKRYLRETTDNTNAYLFMGIIYENKTAKDDILKHTEQALNHIDSAILMFNKASSMLNEKDLKKNEEYYAMYSRTDLRTGNYGVKISDVQFDLRKRSESLRERADKIKMVKYFFSRAESAYNRANNLFITIQQGYPGTREFYLRSDDQLVAKLKNLSLHYDSAAKDFDNYRVSISSLDKVSYKPVWKPRTIKDFKTEGSEPADFYSNEPLVWDYKTFATESIKRMEQELKPIRQELVAYDIEINKLGEKLKKDSVSVRSDLTRLVQNLLSDKLRKFDERPMPLDILAVKVADLEYRSARVDTRRYRDSANVFFQVDLIQRELLALNRLDSVLKIAAQRNLDEEAMNYQDFVNQTYNSTALLKSYVRAQQEYAQKERIRAENELVRRNAALKWLIAGKDSIPLTDQARSAFRPLVLESQYTAGLWFGDKGKTEGYFYDIPPSHRPAIRVRFPVDATAFNESQMQSVKALVTSDGKSQIFFVLLYNSTPLKNKYNVTLAKIYRLDGLAWTMNYALDFIPQSMSYQIENGELRIDSGTGRTVTADKSGKLK